MILTEKYLSTQITTGCETLQDVRASNPYSPMLLPIKQ